MPIYCEILIPTFIIIQLCCWFISILMLTSGDYRSKITFLVELIPPVFMIKGLIMFTNSIIGSWKRMSWG